MIYTIEPKNLQSILSTDFAAWGVEPMRLFAFEPFVGKGIMCTDGTFWEKSRALIKPTFARTQIADLHLSTFDRLVGNLLAILPRDAATVDLQPLFRRLALDSSTAFLFGESVDTLRWDELSKDARNFLEAYNYGQSVLGRRLHLPQWNFLTSDKRFLESCKDAHKFVDDFISRAQRSMKHASDAISGSRRYVLAHELVQRTDDTLNVRNQLLNAFLPAHEAVGVALTNIFFHLSRHPNVWRKLRAEVSQAADSDDKWTFERLKSLKYLQWVVNETFRLNPPIGTTTRMALRDTVLPVGGGPATATTSPIYVKKGDTVTISFYALHRLPEVYGDDAAVFRPETWEGLRPPQWTYLPFGGGPRVCPGQNLAMTEVAYTIVKIAESFCSIECQDPVFEFREVYKISTESGNGAKVSLSPA